jgi:hypothetical protein
VLLLLGALLFCPPFVLGPLAGLLAASRPRTVREWCWVGAAILWIVVMVRNPDGLAWQTVYAWALCVTGVFVLLMLAANAGVVTGALVAVALSFGFATLWLYYLELDWRAVERAVGVALRAWVSRQPDYFGNKAELENAVQVATTGFAGLLPALLAVGILPSLAIAWSWYRRLASTPLGRPAQRFAEFRFSDQLIWGIVLAAIGMVVPIPAPFDVIVGNLTIVIGALYLARGAAVIWSRMEQLPGALLILLGMISLLLWPVLAGAAFALGLADTWVDFRRRAAPVEPTRE